MLHKQKGCTSPMLHKFTLLNLNNEKYFHIFAITSQNKTVNNIIRLNHSSRMNNTLQKKIKPFPNNFFNAQKHPQNENDTTFSIDPPLSSN